MPIGVAQSAFLDPAEGLVLTFQTGCLQFTHHLYDFFGPQRNVLLHSWATPMEPEDRADRMLPVRWIEGSLAAYLHRRRQSVAALLASGFADIPDLIQISAPNGAAGVTCHLSIAGVPDLTKFTVRDD